MDTVTVDLCSAWDIHDAWSETYAVSWIIINRMTTERSVHSPESDYLYRMILVSSNFLYEFAFFSLVEERVNSNLERYTKIKLDNKRVTFRNALKDWPAILGVNIDLSTEPYLSMDKLRDKRNAVIHKKGYFSSIEPAASASTSAVEACKSLFVEFKGIDAFPYDGFIKRYPPRPAPMFSKMA